MKKTILKLSAFLAIFSLAACGGSDGDDDPIVPTPVTTYSGVITENTTWTSDNVYTLDGRVVVPSGVELTIEAGTVIKANAGQEANACAFIVARGGKVFANGTASEPIIFTSSADEITRNHSSYPGFANLDPSYKGLWGGVIILGNAGISADAEAVQIEGIPADDTNGLYGGTNDADNSGVFKYVQIRHGGTLLGEGNEINGLTLGGVGSGTEIHHVEVVANVDDGIEFFGGSVDASHLAVHSQGDDAFDIDQSYNGTITNIVGIADAESDHAFEIDGPEGSWDGLFTVDGATMMGYDDESINGEYADFRKEAMGSMSNVYFHSFSCGSDFEIDGGSSTANLTFSNIIFNVTHLPAANEMGDACNLTVADICDDQTGNSTNFNASLGTSGGANTSEFSGWTAGTY
jgi:hypothetical protein